MTLKELAEGLTSILKDHPELADREVCHGAECSYSGAGFESPVTVGVPVLNEGYKDEDFRISIMSDDDGYWTNSAIKKWEFLSPKQD